MGKGYPEAVRTHAAHAISFRSSVVAIIISQMDTSAHYTCWLSRSTLLHVVLVPFQLAQRKIR